MRGVLIGVALALFAGIASAAAAAPVTPSDVDQFKAGVSTENDVEARLGKPMIATHNSDGSAMLMYYAGKTHVKAATFIPIVGLFAGGVDTSSTAVTFMFDASGVLKSSSSSQSSIACASAIANTGCKSN